MKKFILGLFLPLLYALTLLSAPILTRQATAQEQASYACICDDTAYFYASKDERRGLFLLPQTYYVKILSYDSDFCKIEYLYDSEYTQKLVGYAKTDALTFVDYTPKTPYLLHIFPLQYTINSTEQPTDNLLDTITLTCAYYGDYTIGTQTYCYILRGEDFGYIPKPADFSYEQNNEYAEYLLSQSKQEPTPQDSPTETSNKMSPVQIATLIVLCLLVPALATLITKPPKKPPYEEE